MEPKDEVKLGAKDILIGTIETLTKGLLAVLLYLVNSMDTKIDNIQATGTETNTTVTEIKVQQDNNITDIGKNEERISDLWDHIHEKK